MSKYVFDIETDGLMDTFSKVHSIVIKDIDTQEVFSYADQPEHGYSKERSLLAGVEKLASSDLMIGFNSIRFDVPILELAYPLEFNMLTDVYNAQHMDLLVCSRLIWTDILDRDIRKGTPKELQGKHSLKSWGHRLGILKGDYKDTSSFAEWTPDMQEYCERDVEITFKLWKLIESKNYSNRALELEHKFAEIIAKQEVNGFGFDVAKAGKLYADLIKSRDKIRSALIKDVPATTVELKRPQYYRSKDNTLYETIKDAKEQGVDRKELSPGPPRVKEIPFNPTSRQQVAALLIKNFDWKPKEFTGDGHPKVDETVLSELPYPPAEAISKLFLLEKRIGQLAEGDQAWLRLEKGGRLHGGCNTNGAVSGRVTHIRPNLATVPRVGNPFGKECRSLFIPASGNVLCGFDASSLELRCAAHYLAPYDGGLYVKEVSEGDPHVTNQKAAGLATRDQSKLFIYALIYGAGFQKLGSIVDPSANSSKQVAIGRALKRKFLGNMPAFDQLMVDIKDRFKTVGFLKGLDGRELRIRSEHSATNLLFQSAGALIMKQTLIRFVSLAANRKGLIHQRDYWLVVNVHDEFQWECNKSIANTLGELAIEAIKITRDDFEFRCPLLGEYKVGNNWSETH